MLDHALSLAALGWLIVPVIGKRPCGTEWQKHATANPDELRQLFGQYQPDGFGVQLGERSGVIDFDCDSPEAEQTFQELFGAEITTPAFQSSRGGHRLFRWTNRLPCADKIKFVIDGLEIRTGSGTKGAQTVLPPSGGRQWINDPLHVPLSPLPEAVIQRINQRWNEINKPKRPQRQTDYVPLNGEKHPLNVPKWLTKHNREILGRTEGNDGVTRWHIECPGLASHTTKNDWRDCCVTQDHAGKLGGCCFHASCGMKDWATLRDAIGPLTHDDFNDDVLPVVDLSQFHASPRAKRNTPVDPNVMPEEFYRIPGIIGDMIQHHRQHAPRPRPELSLAASIAMVGVATGQKIKTKSGLRTNVYMIGLAKSGSGKDQPRHDSALALRCANLEKYLGAENPASDASIIEELALNPCRLLQIDEISRYFATLKNASGGAAHLKNIFTRILELTGNAQNPAWTPKGYADQKKVRTIAYPHLCIYGTATAKGFWASVQQSDAVDGFLARMLVIEAPDTYPRLQESEESSPPDNVVGLLREWMEFTPPKRGNLDSDAVVVPIDSAAEDRLRKHSDDIEDRLQSEPDDQQAIWSRCSAAAKRLSLIYAPRAGRSEFKSHWQMLRLPSHRPIGARGCWCGASSQTLLKTRTMPRKSSCCRSFVSISRWGSGN